VNAKNYYKYSFFLALLLLCGKSAFSYETTDARCGWGLGLNLGLELFKDHAIAKEFQQLAYEVMTTTKYYPWKYFSLTGSAGYRFAYGRPSSMNRDGVVIVYDKSGDSTFQAFPINVGLRVEPMQKIPFNYWAGGYYGPEYAVIMRSGNYHNRKYKRVAASWNQNWGIETGFDYIFTQYVAFNLQFRYSWEPLSGHWASKKYVKKISQFYESKDYGGFLVNLGPMFYF